MTRGGGKWPGKVASGHRPACLRGAVLGRLGTYWGLQATSRTATTRPAPRTSSCSRAGCSRVSAWRSTQPPGRIAVPLDSFAAPSFTRGDRTPKMQAMAALALQGLAAAIVAVGFAEVASPQAEVVTFDRNAENAATGCTAPAQYSRAPHRPFAISDAAVYRQECTIARLYGPREIARQYHISSTNNLVICTRTAAENYRSVFSRPAVDGCMRGFRLRGRP
jgi:hypothetical protein